MKFKGTKILVLIVTLLMFCFCIGQVNGKYNTEDSKDLKLDINANYYVTLDSQGGKLQIENLDEYFDVSETSATKIVEVNNTYGSLPSASKTGYTFNGWSIDDESSSSGYSVVPNNYKQIEYLECTKPQYIDTGIVCDEKTAINITFSFEKNVGGVEIFGASNEGFEDTVEMFTKNNKIMYRHNDLYEDISTTDVDTFGYEGGTTPIYTLETNPDNPSKSRLINTTSGYVENINIEQNSFTTPYTLYLFALHRSSVYTNETSNSNVRIYSFSLYEDGELMLNLVPAIFAGGEDKCSQNGVISTRNLSKDTAGFLDIKNNVFYINSNTSNTAKFKTGPFVEDVNEDSIVNISEDHNLYAKWDANRYTVTLNANDNIGSSKCVDLKNSEISVLYDSTYNLLPTITRLGYEFKGWFDSEDSEYTNDKKVEITEDKELFAKWQAKAYEVSFEVDEDTTLIGENKKTIYMDQNYGQLPSATKEGYDFEGWVNKNTIEGFTKIDYLECPGNQYIDTGLKINQDSAINVKFSAQNPSVEGVEIFGASHDGVTNAYELFTKQTTWIFRRNSGNINVNTLGKKTAVGYGDGMEPIYTCITDPNNTSNTIITNTKTGETEVINVVPEKDFESPTTLCVFALHRSSTIITNKNKAAVRIYEFSLYQKGKLVLNLVPAIWNGGTIKYSKNGTTVEGNLSAGTAGMYDTLSETFYINSGTESFVCPSESQEYMIITSETRMESPYNHTLIPKWKVKE